MIERTLVLIKPDGVTRMLSGQVITRFENAGLKIVGLKMVFATKDMALKHYTEDITVRRGQHVRDMLVEFVTQGPIIAIAFEGVHAIANVRRLVGSTEPAAAQPGTIRGDFSHVTYAYSDAKKQVVKNIIHASSDANDAKRELELWFKKDELHSYKTVHDVHLY